MCIETYPPQSSGPQRSLLTGSTAENTLQSVTHSLSSLRSHLWLQHWVTEQDLRIFTINHPRKPIPAEHMA